MTDFYAYDAGLPCRNPNCKSHGRPHPNCNCYAGSESQHGNEHYESEGYYADGGKVHEPFRGDNEYYERDIYIPDFAEGGGVKSPKTVEEHRKQFNDQRSVNIGYDRKRAKEKERTIADITKFPDLKREVEDKVANAPINWSDDIIEHNPSNDKIQKRAISHYNSNPGMRVKHFGDDGKQGSVSDVTHPEYLKQIQLNYLRHNHTNYDNLWKDNSPVSGRTNKSSYYHDLIQDKANNQILDKYPHLKASDGDPQYIEGSFESLLNKKNLSKQAYLNSNEYKIKQRKLERRAERKRALCDANSPHQKDCEHYATPNIVEQNAEFETNPGLAVDHHIVQNGLLHTLTKTGHSKSENPATVPMDYIDGSKRGRKSFHGASDNIFENKAKNRAEPDTSSINGLKQHLDDVQGNPSKMLDIGGSMGNTLPDHATELAAKSATAVNYLNGIKPQSQQNAPLDEVLKPSKSSEAAYDRQLAIAQNPTLIHQHVKDGTLQPSDLTTLHTIYPQLAKSMVSKGMEALVTAKANGTEIPYKQKTSLSLLLGSPLDSTMTPVAMRAIIGSAPGASPTQQSKPKKRGGTTAATQKTIAKTDEMYETPLESRQLDRKS